MGQRALFLGSKVDIAIERMRSFCPPEGHYLACSFGKDSVVLLELAKMAGVKYEAHFHRSTVDPPELIRFGKFHYPEVTLDRPPTSMFKLILKEGCPPTRLMRYCCRIFKEGYGVGRVVLTGVRRAESQNRRNSKLVYTCPQLAKTTINPILDWTDIEIWDFIHTRDIPYSSLYDEGFKRLGCIMCPNGYYKLRLREAERWPRFFLAYWRCFEKLAARGDRTWQSAEEVMRWWLEEKKWKGKDHELFAKLLDYTL